MAKRAIAPANIPTSYAELLRAVKVTMVEGQQAVEQARVRTYHETGRLIHEHVLLFNERANYGAGTIQRLAADLEVHRSVLQRCVQFVQAFPNCAAWRNLAWVKQKLRLRDLDCPELVCAEGRAAKRFVEALIAHTTAVTICTTKPDKYDRYLADVFLTLDDSSTVFLNNALLENGHAVRKDSYDVSDWKF